MYGATKCHMCTDTGYDYVELLVDISTSDISSCEKELEEWAGIKFKVTNYDANNDKVKLLLSNGETLFPASI